jgi:hypothetical protein
VAKDEHRDEAGRRLGPFGYQQAAGDEEQMIPAEEHVLDTERDELNHCPVGGIVDAVRGGRGRQR